MNSLAAVNPVMIFPFVLLLLAIALLPFLSPRWWERYYPALAALLALVTAGYYLLVLGRQERMLQTAGEYASFITLIGSLFVVAGGIHIRIRGRSTPLANSLLLAVGAAVSNLLGTTGASMVLIRPYLHSNRGRLRGFHVVFFIFLVSNIGGALTPIGDPPLFLGYLKGVPFFWVLEQAWPAWALAVGLLLAIFYLTDRKSFLAHESRRRAHGAAEDLHEEAEVRGLHNLFFLAVILLAVFIEHPPYLRELLMLVAAAGSYFTTNKEIRRKNNFTFIPIKEVAILFAGIFVTMVPALDWLELNAARIGVTTAGQFYWGTGILSSVLDNAPTYLNFLSASAGLFLDPETIRQVQALVLSGGGGAGALAPSASGVHAVQIQNAARLIMEAHGDLVRAGHIPADLVRVCYLIANHAVYLKAISIAAVFFGANTYIGNGPNFMVKSIADHAGAKTPTFLGYIGRYSLPVLLPIFLMVWWLFFRA